ncbi:zinc finger BED domain-containing protein RICESLEEPER 2-like [Mercurialis annua]|uniref:zinc finger BED domain-containing protein RICESLEEPER 2-like n=1 Tax=Mercurialis annua TaxID=3986 RepID=UPI002160C2E4|nr:zinc finger BED domain-containing protein RICESLEEPER 2-like [Mercurialis annua]
MEAWWKPLINHVHVLTNLLCLCYGFCTGRRFIYSMSDSEVEHVVALGAAGDGLLHSSPPCPEQEHAAVGEGSSKPTQEKQGVDANVAGNDPATKKRKQIVVRSKVWDHFERIIDEPSGKLLMAKCLYCAKVYNSDTKLNGTSTLRSHNLACLKNPHAKHTRQALLTLQPVIKCDGDEGNGKLGTWKFSQQAIRDAVAYMNIIDELPFRFVEGPGFRRLMNIACPRFVIPSRWTMNRDCYQLYLNERLKLKTFLKNESQRVCITTDTWTSIQRVNYMCVTCHWIDNQWKLHKRILSLVHVCGHKGDYISKTLENCLLAWGLKNVFTITMDNAGNNNTAIAAFKKKMLLWGTNVSKCQYMHMRCIAHVINLVVSDGLKDMNSSVKKVRDCIRYIRNSPSRLKQFKDLANEAKLGTKKSLCLDVPTRWNSTYLMLDTACIFKSVFDSFEEVNEAFRNDMAENIPNIHDWQTVKKFSTCLSYFYVTTLRISGSLYVTSNLHYLEVCDLSIMLDEMTASDDVEIKQMGMRMREKFNKYWGDPHKMNKLIFFSYIFDPTSKLNDLLFSVSSMFGKKNGSILFETAKYELNVLFDEYQNAYLNGLSGAGSFHFSSTQPEEGPVSSQVPILPVPHPAKRHTSLMKAKFAELNKELAETGPRKSELEIYLTEASVENDDAFDVLNWWKQNAARFPILSRMARDILVVPISTVASESAFSTSGRVLDCFRSSLTPRIVETLVCTQYWLRAETIPLVVEENLDELEPFEQDLPIYVPDLFLSLLKYHLVPSEDFSLELLFCVVAAAPVNL